MCSNFLSPFRQRLENLRRFFSSLQKLKKNNGFLLQIFALVSKKWLNQNKGTRLYYYVLENMFFYFTF
jgi:hypothetical protein